MNAEVAEIYGNNESFIGEIVKKEEIHTSFAVSHQTAKVTAAVHYQTSKTNKQTKMLVSYRMKNRIVLMYDAFFVCV